MIECDHESCDHEFRFVWAVLAPRREPPGVEKTYCCTKCGITIVRFVDKDGGEERVHEDLEENRLPF